MNAALFAIEILAMVTWAIIITNNPLVFIADSEKIARCLALSIYIEIMILCKRILNDLNKRIDYHVITLIFYILYLEL